MIRTVAFEGEAVLDGLRADGVVVCEGVLGRDKVAAIRSDVGRLLRETPTGRNLFEGHKTKRLYNLFGKTRVFDDVAVDPVLTSVLEGTIGESQLSAPVGIEIGPGEPTQILHRDDSIYPLPEHHQEVVLNTMWALEDFSAENGATRFVEGSQRWEPGRRPGADDAVTDAEMPMGSVAIYTGSIWHGGGANNTDRPRLGVILEYVAAWLRPQENHVIGVPPEVVAGLPERLQELLGYNIYPPFMGYVDGRHPRRFLPEVRGTS